MAAARQKEMNDSMTVVATTTLTVARPLGLGHAVCGLAHILTWRRGDFGETSHGALEAASHDLPISHDYRTRLILTEPRSEGAASIRNP